tara:strand:- start:243 stop:425 length:183 start_codon:yes stop_codon:yes gene_type:complete
MFVGYESYIAVAICLFCTWLGYTQGKRNGIEKALEGMINLKLLRVNLKGEIVAGTDLKQK